MTVSLGDDKPAAAPPSARRRRLLLGTACALAAPRLVFGAPAVGGVFGRALAPRTGKGPRVVVVGGGWAGLTVARRLRVEHPAFEVVLVERNNAFHSYPLSNLWLADELDLGFLSHSYLDAARNNGYRYVNAAVVDVDREVRRVFTSAGHLDYDYLILAPGIDYDFERTGVDDPEMARLLRYRYPGGFADMSEIFSIKRKIHDFTGGVFCLTIPSDNYRCMAAPYERACMIAALFRRRGISAKLLVLDMNPAITVKRNGFTAAFERLYPDIIDYRSGVEITGIDPLNRRVETIFDEYPFDDGIVYPKIRSARLIEDLGLVDPASPQKAPRTDPFKSHLVDDERVYVIGDSRSQAFSKSGNTAHTEAQYIARLIAARERGREIPWEGPQTMCFSAVKIEPLEAMSLIANYRFDEAAQAFSFDKVHVIENWSAQIAAAGEVWADSMFRDMFYTPAEHSRDG